MFESKPLFQSQPLISNQSFQGRTFPTGHELPSSFSGSGPIRSASGGLSGHSVDLNQQIRDQWGAKTGSVDLDGNVLNSFGMKTGKHFDLDGNLRSANGGLTGFNLDSWK